MFPCIQTYLLNVTFIGFAEPAFACNILFLFFFNLSFICNPINPISTLSLSHTHKNPQIHNTISAIPLKQSLSNISKNTKTKTQKHPCNNSPLKHKTNTKNQIFKVKKQKPVKFFPQNKFSQCIAYF